MFINLCLIVGIFFVPMIGLFGRFFVSGIWIFSYKKQMPIISGCFRGNKKTVTKILSQPFFRINGVLLPTPRSQVTIFNKHEKLFFEIAPCDSE